MKDKKATVFIVEDNIHQLEALKKLVSSFPNLVLVGYSQNGRDAMEGINRINVDLLLLDINLPEMSGMELLENLRILPYIIFITAYDKYAVRAFELGAVDYILKPVTQERLGQSIGRFFAHRGSEKLERKRSNIPGISFRDTGTSYLLAYDDIYYLTADGKKTIMHTENKDFEASSLMKTIEQKLPQNRFLRIHRKFIVNLSFISYIQKDRGSYQVVLKDADETHLPVARSHCQVVSNIFNDQACKDRGMVAPHRFHYEKK